MQYIVDQYPSASNRDKILLAGFSEMYQNGYQGMRIEAVLKATGLAKGALYHHFPNKIALAYAIIDEILYEHSKEQIESRMRQFEDPIDAICFILKEMCENITDEEIIQGCPLNNLAQEMSGLDEGFKERLSKIYESWHESVSTSLKTGQKKGMVKADIDCDKITMFIISAHEGILGTVKCLQSREVLHDLISTLCDYIESLRA